MVSSNKLLKENNDSPKNNIETRIQSCALTRAATLPYCVQTRTLSIIQFCSRHFRLSCRTYSLNACRPVPALFLFA